MSHFQDMRDALRDGPMQLDDLRRRTGLSTRQFHRALSYAIGIGAIGRRHDGRQRLYALVPDYVAPPRGRPHSVPVPTTPHERAIAAARASALATRVPAIAAGLAGTKDRIVSILRRFAQPVGLADLVHALADCDPATVRRVIAGLGKAGVILISLDGATARVLLAPRYRVSPPAPQRAPSRAEHRPAPVAPASPASSRSAVPPHAAAAAVPETSFAIARGAA